MQPGRSRRRAARGRRGSPPGERRRQLRAQSRRRCARRVPDRSRDRECDERDQNDRHDRDGWRPRATACRPRLRPEDALMKAAGAPTSSEASIATTRRCSPSSAASAGERATAASSRARSASMRCRPRGALSRLAPQPSVAAQDHRIKTTVGVVPSRSVGAASSRATRRRARYSRVVIVASRVPSARAAWA